MLTVALRRDPREPSLHYLLGTALVQCGDGARAVFHLEKARAALGRDSRVLMQLGMAHNRLGDTARSISFFEQAAAADQSSDICAVNLASALYADGQLTRALAAAQCALAINPLRVEAAIMCGLIDTHRGECDRGLATLLDATHRHPAHLELWKLIVTTGNYASSMSGENLRMLIERYVQVRARVATRNAAMLMKRPDPHRRLTIAYLSQDLRNRSVGHFVEALFLHHQAEHFQVHAFSMCPEPDELSARLRARCAGWHDVHGWSADAVVALADQIGLDIVIDLAGHTCDESIEPLARRLAPVQMTYCGYPNTTGLASMDYRVVDELTDPAGSDTHATERLIRLPRCFLCYTPPAHAAAVPRPTKAGADTGRVRYVQHHVQDQRPGA